MYFKNERNQPELFDDFAASAKPRQPRLNPVKKLRINASHELVLFGCILLLMTVIVSFGIGFERGKRITRQSVNKITQPVAFLSPVSTLPEKTDIPARQEKKQVPKKYAVQLVAYTQKNYANKQIQKLLKSGYRPFMLRNSKFYLVYIGPYPDKKTARSDLVKVKSRSLYQDAFITTVK